MTTTEPPATGIQPDVLQRLLDGRYRDLREQIREALSSPELDPPIAISTPEYRERVREWMNRIAESGLTAPGFPYEYGGQGDPAANIAGFETISFGDVSLLVKCGVQFGLWGGAIQQLGTRIHHERYLKPTATLELRGWTFEGDNTVLVMLVARGLLTDYRDAFGELNPRETPIGLR